MQSNIYKRMIFLEKVDVGLFSNVCRVPIDMIGWKEWEQEVDEIASFRDLGTIVSLRNFGLLNFFRTLSMRS